jgi:hypothetical protein
VAIVTLTTDFGTSDGYAGAMKGVILSRAPDAVIADIAHDVARHDVAAGAYALMQAASQFPAGAIHVAVVDPGVGTPRPAVVIEASEYLFVGPDNGLFALVVGAGATAYAIESEAFRLSMPSKTFHGRDVFAAAAGALAAGASPSDAGPRVELTGSLSVSTATTGGLTATIVHVDSFGNLITDLDARRIPSGARFWVGGRLLPRLSATFADVRRGELVAYIGSASTLEVAVREGHAAEVLGLARGALVAIEGPE